MKHKAEIIQWAKDRNLNYGNPKNQTLKLLEEIGELAQGLNKGNREQIIDSIGDSTVVLIILCEQLGLDIEDCLGVAYEEIKNRTGEMVDGIFVKSEDFQHE